MSIAVGDRIPAVTVYTAGLEAVNLQELASGKQSVFLFFPASFTGVCEKELCTFTDAIAQYNDLGAAVYGISVDLPFSQKAFAEKHGISFPLYSDFNKEAIHAFGNIIESLKGLKNVAQRAVFVTDETGTVRWKWVADAPTQEPPYNQVKAAVEGATASA